MTFLSRKSIAKPTAPQIVPPTKAITTAMWDADRAVVCAGIDQEHHHVMNTARECNAELRLHQYHHPQDSRTCACVPVQQIDITPHD
jgi:hypothetical protein